MPTTYTSLLGLALPVTGELAGTWGDTVNDYITKYVDSSVAGTQTISGSQTAVTLTRANGGALSQAGSGATGSSQYQVINCTGNPAGTLTVTVDVTTGSPTLSNSTYSQTFAVINGTSTSQSVVVRATTTSGTSTGVTLVSGEKALIAWNGSDFIKVATSTVDGVSTIAFGTTGLTPSSATSGAVTVAGTLVAANGGTGQSSYTTGDLLYATGSTALSKLGIGTNGQILTSTGTAPQWSTLSGVAVTTFSAGTTGFTPSTATSGAVTLAGTLATTNGGTGLTSFTANGVVYASSSSALTTGSALTFNGSAMSVGSGGNGGGASMAMTVNGTFGGGIQQSYNNNGGSALIPLTGGGLIFYTYTGANGSESYSEAMRLTSTGLGIGTSSPAYKLDVAGTDGSTTALVKDAASGNQQLRLATDSVLVARSSGSNGGLTLGTVSQTWGASGGFVKINTNGSTVATFDTSGNLGLGVTPSAWETANSVRALQFNGGQISSYSTSYLWVGQNFYRDSTSTEKYVNNGFASKYQQNSGIHSWYYAASGTAGNTVTFTQAMTLDASGQLSIGATSANSTLTVGNTDATATITSGGTNTHLNLRAMGSGGVLIFGAGGVSNGTPGTERMRLDASGNLGVGTTSPGCGVDVQKAASTDVGGRYTIRSFDTTTAAQGVGGGIAFTGYYTGTSSAANFATIQGIKENGTSGNFASALTFTTRANSGDLTERARITSVGNLSLGGTADRGTTVGTNAIQIFNGTAPAGTLTNGVSLYSSSGDLNFMNSSGNGFKVGYRNLPPVGTQTGSYTLATGDVGKYVQVGSGGSITIPDATFAEGDAVSIFNNTTGNITITCSITTAYIAGTDSDKATMTLATRGVATILFISSTVCVVSGNVT